MEGGFQNAVNAVNQGGLKKHVSLLRFYVSPSRKTLWRRTGFHILSGLGSLWYCFEKVGSLSVPTKTIALMTHEMMDEEVDLHVLCQCDQIQTR